MSDKPVLTLEYVEQEEARLRARLAKLAVVKELLLESSAQGSAVVQELARPAWPNWQEPAKAVPAAEIFLIDESLIKDREPAPSFDGTFAGLIARYRSDERSPFHALKHNVRVNYELSLKRLEREIGSERVADWSAERIRRIYDENWAADGKLAMGHAMVAKLRLLSSFGSTTLNDDACIRLSTILSNMRFEMPKGRVERLTRAHVRAIRVAAREHFGWDSIALVQAIQFEFPMLSKVDIIGEWVPMAEPGTSDITRENEKWITGLRWSDIDDSMILRRELTSGRKNQRKMVEFDLKHFAMTMEELNRVPPWRRKGPLVICEFSGLPWSNHEFRRKWRIVADKAGVPKNVRFSDNENGKNDPVEADETVAGKISD